MAPERCSEAVAPGCTIVGMAANVSRLSKSKLISAWQCAKKVYLEVHHPEVGEISAKTESLFATGRHVGDVARRLYAGDVGTDIPLRRSSIAMVGDTRAAMAKKPAEPVFEATFEHEGVLVRVDALLPDHGGWKAIEVKASTSVKDYHVVDCAIQDRVMRDAGLNVTGISLAHIDNQFVYEGDGCYDGLLVETDLTTRVRTLQPTVVALIEAARRAVGGREPEVVPGAQCRKPYECQFLKYCWPYDVEYPLIGLGGSMKKLGEYAAQGCRDIRDVESAAITADTQLRIHRVTQSGRPEILEGAAAALRALPYPRFYLDFETIAPPVPFWKGTRPYQAVPVQWSCHVDEGSGDGRLQDMQHVEFLDLSGAAPMRGLAEALIDTLGDNGPVLMYTDYEEKVLRTLIDLFPEFERPLLAIIARLFDLHPVVKVNYYHPRMLGSWSIKSVMPTIDPAMDYGRLDGIREGAAAADGFIEAIDDTTPPHRKAELERQLRRYCRFDTEAMVQIVRFFSRRPEQGGGGPQLAGAATPGSTCGR